jgi:hypothetical protein
MTISIGHFQRNLAVSATCPITGAIGGDELDPRRQIPNPAITKSRVLAQPSRRTGCRDAILLIPGPIRYGDPLFPGNRPNGLFSRIDLLPLPRVSNQSNKPNDLLPYSCCDIG